MKFFSFLPQFSATAGKKKEKKIPTVTVSLCFIANVGRQESYRDFIIFELCSITGKWPLGIKKKRAAVLYLHLQTPSFLLLGQALWKEKLLQDWNSLGVLSKAGGGGLSTSGGLRLLNHRAAWNFVRVVSVCGKKLLSHFHQHPVEENLVWTPHTSSLESSFYVEQFTFAPLRSHQRRCYPCWHRTLGLSFFCDLQNLLGNEFCSFAKKRRKKRRVFLLGGEVQGVEYIAPSLQGGDLALYGEGVSAPVPVSGISGVRRVIQPPEGGRCLGMSRRSPSCVLPGSPRAVMGAWRPASGVDTWLQKLGCRKAGP